MSDDQHSENVRNELSFEDFSHQNGEKYWLASEFLIFLGYRDLESGNNAVTKARQTCLTLGIEPDENIKRIDSPKKDFRLNRFACYLVAMNASTKLPNVAKAQAYFAYQAEQINIMLENSASMERLEIREEVRQKTKVLNGVASQSGVINFALFVDAGYRGLYNRGLNEIKKYKGLDQKKELLDHISGVELAANLFRITQTSEKLKLMNVTNENVAMRVHTEVGESIRQIYKVNTGSYPEDSPLEKGLNEVKTTLKKSSKKLKEIDNMKTKPNKLRKDNKQN